MNKKGMADKKLKVLVIGGGWNGLYALKWLAAEEWADVTLFEKDVDIGGNWLFRPNRPGGVYERTHATASKTYLHASDFPMPADTPYFPRHDQILAWLRSYLAHFDLNRLIKLNTSVVSLRRLAKGWEVRYFKVDLNKSKDPYWKDPVPQDDSQVMTAIFDRVVVATGQNIPTTPQNEPPYCNFKGQHVNSDEYKNADPYVGKNVLVLGGGESASDIAYECGLVANKCYMSMRSGVWLHDRLMGSTPADVLVNRAVYMPGRYKSSLIRAAQLILEIIWGSGGSGVAEWQPKGHYFRSFLNKSRDVMQLVSRGLVIPRAELTRCEGKKVWSKMHEDEEPDEIDVFIYATGFRANLQILEEKYRVPLADLYDYVFNTDDTTLAFCGTARPIFGSFLAMAELQARYIAAVWGGRVTLPDSASMKREVESVREWHAACFTNDDKRLSTLVNHWDYCDRIASRIGAKPHLWREYLTNPRRWWWLFAGTWTPFQYLINDPERREEAFRNILQEWPVGNNGFLVAYYWALVHTVIVHVIALGILYYVGTLVYARAF